MADESDEKQQKNSRPVDKRPGDPQVGVALRSVYQNAVEEAVPDDLLDLLSKLD